MKSLFFAIFGLVSMSLMAQEASDVIFLKDGSVYRGSLIEYKAEEEAIIKLLDDRTITIPYSEIYSMKVEDEKVIKKQFELKDKGFFNHTFGGLQWGRNEFNDFQTFVMLHSVNGWRIDQHHPGLGLGIENHAGNWYLPIYADYSYHILDNHTNPIIGVNGGYMMPIGDTEGERYGYSGGYFLGGKIGLIAHSSKKVAFILYLSYRYIRLSGAEYTQFNGFDDFNSVEGEAELHRIGLSMGVAFN